MENNDHEIIENPGIRWEEGIPHHPKSIEVFEFISKLDFKFGDYFHFKCGGDGDNGEHLMYLLDTYFEKKDKEIKKEC